VNQTTPLQGLHVSALVVLDGVRAIVIVPFEHHVLAFVLVEALRFTVGVGSVKVGRRGADLNSAGRSGGGQGEDGGHNRGQVGMDVRFAVHRLILLRGCYLRLMFQKRLGVGPGAILKLVERIQYKARGEHLG
jgi:hypothetical protein